MKTNLSVYNYYERLQYEWVVCMLRVRIYPKSEDKAYWDKVASGKKEKIQDISERNNNLVSIFSDPSYREAIERKVYRNGFPNFYYPQSDITKRKQMERTDKIFYFMKGSEVRFRPYEESGNLMEGVGTVVSINTNDEVTILYEGDTYVRGYLDNVVRIL